MFVVVVVLLFCCYVLLLNMIVSEKGVVIKVLDLTLWYTEAEEETMVGQ